MKAPLRVLLVSIVVSIVVMFIALYRYDLIHFGSNKNTTEQASSTQDMKSVPTASADSTHSNAEPPAQAEQAQKKPTASVAMLEQGKKLYEEKTCALCHGADGKAETPTGKAMNATNLASGQFRNNKENKDAELYVIDVIKNGVPGTAMVSFSAQIPSEDDQKALAAYVVSLSKAQK